MDKDQLSACKDVVKKLLSRPIARLFMDANIDLVNPDTPHPLSLQSIIEKLERNVYVSPYEFILDMHQLFLNADSYEPSASIRPAAGEFLLKDFEESMAEFSPLTSNLYRRLIYLSHVLISPSPPVSDIENKTTNNTVPASVIFSGKEYENSSDISKLSNELMILKSSKQFINAIAFIWKYCPECISIDSDLSIKLFLMPPDIQKRLRKYVRSMLSDSASSLSRTLENGNPFCEGGQDMQCKIDIAYPNQAKSDQNKQ